MSLSEEAGVELLQQLRTAGQLMQTWVAGSAQRGEHGLQPAAVILLGEIATHGESRPSDLAKRKMVDVSVISRQVAQLAAAGLVERRPAPGDGRSALVSLSEQGRAAVTRWRAKYVEFVRSALNDWTEDEITALTGRLESMNEAMRRALGDK